MVNSIKGSCLCETIKFRMKDDFSRFFFCHCKQCRKLTGAACAANLFTSPDNIEWIKGKEKISLYEHKTRNFFNAFCSSCGSRLPMLHKCGLILVVPVGCLESEPSKVVDANIFIEEKESWYDAGLSANAVRAFEGQNIPLK